ncbi:MAG TPA: M23 family metallopeptidase [Leptospiraceae bacterium]|nr:M23 family metallopeptidase [Leptospiraceae bacterium]HNF24962.1 M23 family metallopeptidase [Leptospiraceae bacterium]HNI98768.1 M23 family metallopeptidase [Leptospiraceae bacterium]HNN03629.1 M23 family metallopeptidase [Leptospiraceae bacterium]HNO21761.1 M23 family metallopeptidase [Leptospiraceae bacterium]
MTPADFEYPILAGLFFLSLILTLILTVGYAFLREHFEKQLKKSGTVLSLWLTVYIIFIIYFTGPEDLSKYPPSDFSPYKLPWSAGVSRFTAQGNKSFTSHRGLHSYAWDFVMPIGTEILAVREGTVSEIEDSYDGIGFRSNFLKIRHIDKTESVYAHIKKNSSLVKLGENVKQGQAVALSGMVGQTIFPHLHFYVTGKDGKASIPVSFLEGLPLAGHSYISKNIKIK